MIQPIIGDWWSAHYRDCEMWSFKKHVWEMWTTHFWWLVMVPNSLWYRCVCVHFFVALRATLYMMNFYMIKFYKTLNAKPYFLLCINFHLCIDTNVVIICKLGGKNCTTLHLYGKGVTECCIRWLQKSAYEGLLHLNK